MSTKNEVLAKIEELEEYFDEQMQYFEDLSFIYLCQDFTNDLKSQVQKNIDILAEISENAKNSEMIDEQAFIFIEFLDNIKSLTV